MWKGKLSQPLHSMDKYAMVIPDNGDQASQVPNVLGLQGPMDAVVLIETVAGDEVLVQCSGSSTQQLPSG